MPPPSSENDLKRRARRRLIGAVALTLVAVVVLPLLLENEPQPGSPLAVRMAVVPPAKVPVGPSGTDMPASTPPVPAAPKADTPPPAVAEAEPVKPAPVKPAPATPAPSKPEPKAEPKPESKPQPRSEAPKPQAKPVPSPAPAAKPAAAEHYSVQVAALQDAAKVRELEARVGATGLPVYTDRLGPLTRVRVGPFATREAAQEAVRKLHAAGVKDAVLAP